MGDVGDEHDRSIYWPAGEVERIVQGFSDAYAKELAGVLELATASVQQQLSEALRPFYDYLAEVSSSLVNFGDLLEGIAPSNWPSAHRREIENLIDRTGWALVWEPSADVLSAMLAVDGGDDDRLRVLVGRSEEVLAGCEARLTEIESPHLSFDVEAVRQVLGAIRNGSPMAAQALAAVAVERFARRFAKRSIAAAGKEMAREDNPIAMYRLVLIGRCVKWAATDYWVDRGDPIPEHFNRHASVHALGEVQYTQANALLGALLVTGFVREVEEQQRPIV